jgi:hypothetical protein
MQHSIAAKYAARPAARFVRSSPRARERRLGLHTTTFQAASSHQTMLRRTDLSPYIQLRARWRSIRPARVSSGFRSGLIKPAVSFRWMRLGRPVGRDKSSAASAPWLA